MITEEVAAKVRALYKEGASRTTIAKELGLDFLDVAGIVNPNAKRPAPNYRPPPAKKEQPMDEVRGLFPDRY